MESNERTAIESLFYIQAKTGEKVPFTFNSAQIKFEAFDSAFTRVRVIIAKARQKGFTSLIAGKFGIRCMGKEGTHAAVVSHEATATQRILDKVDYYLKNMNGPSPLFGRHSRTEMYFEKTQSTYFIGTAGAKAFGRGDTITDLHCSEYAWWEDPTKHSTGLFQAVPYNGRIYIESTGNGRNNDFYYIWENAQQMGFEKFFYPWHADLEYIVEPPSGRWKPDTPRYNSYLIDLQKRFKLSDPQMYWYELKLRELREDLRLIQQEYPSSPEECFQATGGAVFEVELKATPEWVADNFEGFYISRLMGHPKKDYHYVIGGDPSGGTGNDDAGINIFCVELNEQVFEFHNNRADPIVFGELLCKLGRHFNNAFIVTESNNHGAAVIPYLKTNYIKKQIYKRSYGTRTAEPVYGWSNTRSTKHALIGTMLDNMPEVIFHGMQIVKELNSFEEKDGIYGGRSDNLVISAGLGILGLQKFSSLRKEYCNPKVIEVKAKASYLTTTLEDVLARINKKSGSTLAQVKKG